MSEIKCPHCGQSFTVDEAGYAAILQQVRNEEFQKEVQGRLKEEREHWAEKHTAEKKNEIGKAVSEKEKEINELNVEIERLKAAAEKSSAEKELAVKNAVSEEKIKFEQKIKEADEKLSKQQDQISQLNSTIVLNDEKHKREQEKAAVEKDKKIADLQSQIDKSETEHKLRLNEELSKAERKLGETEAFYKATLEQKDEQINQLKDYKLKLSTKGVGEDLEQYCSEEFEKQLASILPNATFKKDNDNKKSGKGDYIYRECDEKGIEIISIMFEMKNESEESKTKQKNDKFFEKLDKNRKEKNCEYAILVSMLEQGKDMYDQGIYEVSRSTYGFEKMYVIRPQFFIQMIKLLRNMALNSLPVKQELEMAKKQYNDMTHFRENLAEISKGIHENYRSAGEYFRDAIAKIQKSIDFLNETKEVLKSFEDELHQASNAADGLTIENLTKGIPAMIEMFDREES